MELSSRSLTTAGRNISSFRCQVANCFLLLLFLFLGGQNLLVSCVFYATQETTRILAQGVVEVFFCLFVCLSLLCHPDLNSAECYVMRPNGGCSLQPGF